MVSVSTVVDRIWQNVDYTIGIIYTPPEGDVLSEIEFSAFLLSDRGKIVNADTLVVNPTTGEIIATWEEKTTAYMVAGTRFEARFIRKLRGQTRGFYTRKSFVE